MIIDNDIIKQIMDKIAQIEVGSNDKYKFDQKRVPRVTEVLSAMLHNDSLMNWANGLGWKRISYTAFMKDAADKGTYSHMAIENYLKEGKVDLSKLNLASNSMIPVIESCVDGFLKWWKDLHDKYKNIEVEFIEESLVHSYFGGTCDCVLKVDDRHYLIDFKTSNQMSYNYALQLAAYRFLFREIKNINIDKCCILMLNKLDHTYKTYELDLEIPSHKEYLDECEQTFLMLVASYKLRLYTTEKYYDIFNIQK